MKFMNMNKWLYSNPQDKADDLPGGGGGDNTPPMNDSTPSKDDAPGIDYDKLAQAMLKAQGNQPPKKDDEDTRSSFQKQKDSEKEDRKKDEDVNVIREQVRFDQEFDRVIDDNKRLFNDLNTSRVREDAKAEELDGADLVNFLQANAAQAFFSSKDNLALLNDSDQRYVESSVLGKRERVVEGSKAWSILQSAMHIAKRLKHTNHTRGAGKDGNGQSTTPKLDSFIEKAKARTRPKTAA